jgi:hypothetical protein
MRSYGGRMTIETAKIEAYLVRYGASLTELDAEAAANLWSTPGMIADDRFSGVLESRDAMVEGLRGAYPLYTKLGLGSVGHELLEVKPLSEHLVLVRGH